MVSWLHVRLKHRIADMTISTYENDNFIWFNLTFCLKESLSFRDPKVFMDQVTRLPKFALK